jgi:hypothetical protein
VGDHGVFLVSNGVPMLTHNGGINQVVAYANEVNPTTRDFTDWWAAKQASFGGDDGCEFLAAGSIADALQTYPEGRPFVLSVTSEEIGVVGYPATRAGA